MREQNTSGSVFFFWLRWHSPKPPCATEENQGICFQVSWLLWNKILSASVLGAGTAAGHMLPLGGKVGVLLHVDSWTDKLWIPCVWASILWVSSATPRSCWKENREPIQEVLKQDPSIWQRYQAPPGMIIIPLSLSSVCGHDGWGWWWSVHRNLSLHHPDSHSKKSLLAGPLWNPSPPRLWRHREKS